MLKLLRSHLRPYRKWLLAVLVFQAIQATASLLLPSLNADIIDKGVLRGDTGHIWSIGAKMLVAPVIEVPILLSLGVIVALIGGALLLSAYSPAAPSPDAASRR